MRWVCWTQKTFVISHCQQNVCSHSQPPDISARINCGCCKSVTATTVPSLVEWRIWLLLYDFIQNENSVMPTWIFLPCNKIKNLQCFFFPFFSPFSYKDSKQFRLITGWQSPKRHYKGTKQIKFALCICPASKSGTSK